MILVFPPPFLLVCTIGFLTGLATNHFIQKPMTMKWHLLVVGFLWWLNGVCTVVITFWESIKP